MKNFNLTLAIIPSIERDSLIKNDEDTSLFIDEWLRKKSLSTKIIKNYKSVIECIIGVIKNNLSSAIANQVKIKENMFYITSENVPIILDIINDFTSKYKLVIQKDLAQILYVYELKTFNEIIKEINNYLKILADYLNELNNNLSLVIIGSY